MNKLISIIVPILNEEEHISKFISSIILQTHRSIELLLIDGGSNDKTLSTIYRFINNNKDESIRIKLINEYGIIKSPANARNIGLDNASGEFILMIDCDTLFDNKYIIKNSIYEMNTDDSILIKFRTIIDTDLEQYISDISKRSGVILYRKNLINKNRFISFLGYGEDRVFTYNIFGNLDYLGNVASVTIGRHYPHTVEEYAKQNEWYGHTIFKYIKVSSKTNRNDMYMRIIFVLYNIVVCVYPFMGIFMNYRYKTKNPIEFVKSFVYSFVASTSFVKGLVKL